MKSLPAVLFSILALVLVGAFAFSRLSSNPGLSGTAIEAMPAVPDLSLSGSDGKAHKLSDSSGKVRLVFFGFTRCPDTCPLTLAALARTYESLGSPKDLQIVLVSVDPLYDTPGRLEQYVNKFNPSVLGLTGAPQDIARFSSAFYVGVSGKASAIQHTDAVMVVDRQNRFRMVYNQDHLTRQDLYRDLPAILRWP